MVRVLAIADEVCEPLWGPRAAQLAPDLVVAAGDLPWDYLEFMASSLDVPVVFVILNNGTYGALRRFTEHLDTGETPGLDVPDISFTKLAEGYDVASERVDNAEDLANALTKAFAANSPVLIEAITYFD